MDIIKKARDVGTRIVLPNKYSSEAYVKFLRKKGCHIGKNTHFMSYPLANVDITRPWLVSIGDFCKIGAGATILTHDASINVLMMKYKDILEEFGLTSVGNNVFIGPQSIILGGVTVGNNCVIGIGSVVTRDIPDNSVAAGVPARVISSLDDYYKKMKQNFVKMAKEYAILLYNKNGKPPTIQEMGGFYPLYLKRDLKQIEKHKLHIKFAGGDYEDTVKHFLASKPVYETFEKFLDEALADQKAINYSSLTYQSTGTH